MNLNHKHSQLTWQEIEQLVTTPSKLATVDEDGLLQIESSRAITLREFVPFFIARFKSKETRRTYLNTLKEFWAFLSSLQNDEQNDEQNNVKDIELCLITEDDVLHYRNMLLKKHQTPSLAQTTIARKISTLRSFFSYAQKKSVITEHPLEFLRPPRVPRRSRTRALTPEETGRILLALDRGLRQNKKESRKQRAFELRYIVLLTLLTTGLRVSELCGLKMGDISVLSEQGFLNVLRKGGHVQRILLHPLTSQVLVRYKNSFRLHALTHEPFFIRTQKTQRAQTYPQHLTPKAVWLMVKESAREAGISDLPSPHSCRATLATEMHRQGILLHRIQDLLGHSSLTTTSLYVKKLRAQEESASVKLKTT